MNYYKNQKFKLLKKKKSHYMINIIYNQQNKKNINFNNN